MGTLSVWHWAIVAVVVVILFGSKKLPEAARGLGRSMRIFKSEIKEMHNEDQDTSPADQLPKSVSSERATTAETISDKSL